MIGRTVWRTTVLFLWTGVAGPAACGDDERTPEGDVGPPGQATSSTVALVPSPGRGAGQPDARLGFRAPEAGERFEEGEAVAVALRVSGYDLGRATPGGTDRGIARSSDGQHLHLVVNDEPYRAVYDTDGPVVLEGLAPGTHVLRAFPALDWHESVKSPGAFATRVIHVGDGEIERPPELDGPLLTYSRPVGEYRGAEADSVLVDFYLSGVRLSPEGFRVRVTLDEGSEWILTSWEPHLLMGLPEGDHTVRLQLLDPEGVPVPGELNRAERSIRIRR